MKAKAKVLPRNGDGKARAAALAALQDAQGAIAQAQKLLQAHKRFEVTFARADKAWSRADRQYDRAYDACIRAGVTEAELLQLQLSAS